MWIETKGLLSKSSSEKKYSVRGGKRSGSGRKTEYHEPVQKILVSLPEFVLNALDEYGQKHQISRPKAVAKLLQMAQTRQRKEQALAALRELQK